QSRLAERVSDEGASPQVLRARKPRTESPRVEWVRTMAKRIAQVSRAADCTPIGVLPVSFLTPVGRAAPFRSVLCAALKCAYTLTPSAFRCTAYLVDIRYC